MIVISKTNAENRDFKELVQLLNADLAKRDGENHPLSQFNQLDGIRYVVMAYKKGKPVGCGAIKDYGNQAMEVKRMFVLAENRGKGIATKILKTLESWAKELSCTRCILLTGINQPEANEFYLKNGYIRIPAYGALKKIKDSRCFAKELH